MHPGRGIRASAWRAIDLWGATRSEGMLFFALIFTGAFVLLEAKYNRDLLNTIIDPTATRETVRALSDRGRALASLGIAWVIGRSLLDRVRPALLGVVLLGAVAGGVYVGLDHVYTRVIDGLPVAVKLKGLNLFGYRRELLLGNLSEPDIPLPSEDPIAGRIIMGSFPMLLVDDHYMGFAGDVLDRKVGNGIRDVVRTADESWPAYAARMAQLREAHREFVANSTQAIAAKELGGIDEFRKRSGGLSPDPSITPGAFVEMLRGSSLPQGQSLREAEAVQLPVGPGAQPMKMGDLPLFMDHAQYLAWFSDRARKTLSPLRQTVDTVGSMEGINDINAAVFLPPMAMIASLTSALTNSITFLLLAATLALRGAPAGLLRNAGMRLSRYSTVIMLALLAIILLAMPPYVFQPGPMRTVEDEMHRQVGLGGEAWSRLSRVQALLLVNIGPAP